MRVFHTMQLLVLLVLVAVLSIGLKLSLVGTLPPRGSVEQTEASSVPSMGDPLPTQTTAPPDGGPSGQPVQPTAEPSKPAAQPPAVRQPYRVALTFDDGPHSTVTPFLLDGLQERGVHVTFFILGVQVKGREAVLQRIAQEGHQLANHSYSHSRFARLTADGIRQEVTDTADLVEAACGQRPWAVRPPYGATDQHVRDALEEPLVMWSVDPEDWRLHDAQAVYDAVLSTAKDGDIILMHDTYQSSAEAALRIIDTLREQGFDFVTVDELFAESDVPLVGDKPFYKAPPRTAQTEAGTDSDPSQPTAGDLREAEEPFTDPVVTTDVGDSTDAETTEHRQTPRIPYRIRGRRYGLATSMGEVGGAPQDRDIALWK